MVYARQRCIHHGGKKLCTVPGCGITRRLGDFCSKHAPQKKRCSTEGCETLAHLQGKCVRHGGGRMCKVDQCTSHARNGPYCGRHFKLLCPPVAPVEAPPASLPRISPSMVTPTLPLGQHHDPYAALSRRHHDYDADYVHVSSPPPELLHLDLNDDSGFEDNTDHVDCRQYM
ncbi:hypothetical protein DYB32_010132 [Aphanomyces invadans]|nr:hypothetical protein DYB32_010132 [Aphanomyces invadans]